MKKTVLALSLVAVLAACGGGAANNSAGAPANTVGNSSMGLPTPPARPPELAGQQAGLPPGLDCIRNALSPEERRQAAVAIIELGPRAQGDPRVQTLRQAGDTCGEEQGWSEEKTELAIRFSLSAAGGAAIREMLGAQGIQIQNLDRTILSDPELMAAAEGGRLTPQVGEAFAMRHREELERLVEGRSLEGELGARVGNYMAFIAMAQIMSARFANVS